MADGIRWTADRAALRMLFHERRRQLAEDVEARKARLREQGAESSTTQEADDTGAPDLDVVLIDIGTANLHCIDQAIERLDTGAYGRCTRCQRPISEARLRALPFAVACRECESAREQAAGAHGPRRPFGTARVTLDWSMREEL